MDTNVLPRMRRKTPRRDYRFDNIRALLIFLVVFCHLCETFCNPDNNPFYLLIYSFHIPCLLFVSGYFSRYDAKKLAKHILLPYAVFQFLYSLYDCAYLNPQKDFSLQFTFPYWIMWYLLTLFCCCLLIPLLKTNRPWPAAGMLAILTTLSLHIGTDNLAGYTGSLSRTVVFLPCFFFGYYTGTSFAPNFVEGLRYRRRILIPILVAIVAMYCFILLDVGVSTKLLYGAYSYKAANAFPWQRLMVLAGAMTWMLLLLCLSPAKKIPIWTVIGQRTMPIYLLHGFLQRLFLHESFFHFNDLGNYLLALSLTCTILVLLSCKPVYQIFKTLF